MEDEEDNLSTVNNNSSLHEVEDSIMEAKLPERDECPNGEQCDLAPNLDDSKLETVESPIVLKEEEIETEENMMEMKAEPKFDDEAAVEEIPRVDTKTETEVEEAKGGGGEIAVELSNTHPVDVYSPIGAEIETVDIKPEIEPPALVEAETSKGNAMELVDELHELQPVGTEPSIVVNHDGVDDDTAAEEEIPADAKMDGDGEGEEEEEGEEIPGDAKMDEEGEEGESDDEEGGKGSGDEIDGLQVVGGEDEIEEDDAMVGEEETPSLDTTEMETETDAADSVKVGGGRRKRGRNSKGTAKAPVTSKKKTIEEDVCFICFDGGELVLCDRR